MAKAEVSHSEMAVARQRDGVNVIFDKDSPASHRSRSQSRHRRCYRSSSTSSSSSSSYRSHSRSRSRPRCHRRSSRCHCDDHRRYGHGRHRRSPPRRLRAHSRSYSRPALPDTHSRRRSHRSRSRSLSRLTSPKISHRRNVSRVRCKSRSPGHTLSLTLDAKRELLASAKANAMKTLGVDKLDLPVSVKPILSEHSETSEASPEPEKRVRRNPEKTWVSQSDDEEPGDVSSPKTSPKRKIISFSVNNSIAKPTVVAPSSIKVTARVDSYESRRPYGHWVPVKSGHSSKARKHTLTMSR